MRKRNRTKMLAIRTSEGEYGALVIMSNGEGFSISEMLRTCIRNEAHRRGMSNLALLDHTSEGAHE